MKKHFVFGLLYFFIVVGLSFFAGNHLADEQRGGGAITGLPMGFISLLNTVVMVGLSVTVLKQFFKTPQELYRWLIFFTAISVISVLLVINNKETTIGRSIGGLLYWVFLIGNLFLLSNIKKKSLKSKNNLVP